ncbi:type II secretion system minor pseudopilin GspK [Ramlibacter sp. G-1-2-2]|uniref:Type II secretion system protein K n=1 Tax=Ramlibacter agri TaxID=2728837 RepID=A0A848HGD1_9BURK|nr:type II secretion system minor pseudopilin GspK [Ramlibacter agri]NML48381.1 type II secretion system minor pseudopilin GspK [Ramlibacter agri]
MKRRSTGAALLAAMLTVMLVATFAAAALWQQWRGVEVESAERTRQQASWILTGALDWARLILREDARSTGGVDHLGEPWAVPLQESRLSTFLSADSSDASNDADAVFLSGEITDLQSFLNVQDLFQASSTNQDALESFRRLFSLLGLPTSELGKLAENFRFASDISVENLSSSRAPLAPTRVEQLTWLGLSPDTVAALQPYITLLPQTTTVNVNTASAQVIYAAARNISLADAERLVAVRQGRPFRTTQDVVTVLPEVKPDDLKNLGFATSYFEVRGRVRQDEVVIEERSVVQRNSTTVTTLSRERGVLDATAQSLIQQAQRR